MYRRFYREADSCDAYPDIDPGGCDEDEFLEIYDQLGAGCGGMEPVFYRGRVCSGRCDIQVKKRRHKIERAVSFHIHSIPVFRNDSVEMLFHRNIISYPDLLQRSSLLQSGTGRQGSDDRSH